MKHKFSKIITIFIIMLIAIFTLEISSNAVIREGLIRPDFGTGAGGDSGNASGTIQVSKSDDNSEFNAIDVADDGNSYIVYSGSAGADGRGFSPMILNGPWGDAWVFCISHGAGYKATYANDQLNNAWHYSGRAYRVEKKYWELNEDTNTYEWWENASTLQGGEDWGKNPKLFTMEYKNPREMPIEENQDVGYILKYGKTTNGEYNRNTSALAIWTSEANNGSSKENTELGREAVAYKRFYEQIHNNSTPIAVASNATNDIATAPMTIANGIDNFKLTMNRTDAKVGVNQADNSYIVGPFNITYPNGYNNGQNKFSWVSKIIAITDNGEQPVSILLENGKDVTNDIVRNGSQSLNNVNFYIKFKDASATKVTFKIEMGYIESFDADLQVYTGTRYQWYYNQYEWKCTEGIDIIDKDTGIHVYCPPHSTSVHPKQPHDRDDNGHCDEDLADECHTRDEYYAHSYDTVDVVCNGKVEPTNNGGKNTMYKCSECGQVFDNIPATHNREEQVDCIHVSYGPCECVPGDMVCTQAEYIVTKKEVGGKIQDMMHVRRIKWQDEETYEWQDDYVREIDKTTSLEVSFDLLIEIGGTVFLDQDQGKANQGNNILDNNEQLAGVEVRLYNQNNTLIGIKLTDGNGHYIFENLNPLNKYYVCFTYNGMLYTNVEYNPFGANTSKAIEDAQGNGGNRSSFNSKFSEIRSYPQSYQSSGGFNKTYYQEEVADLFKAVASAVVSCNGDENQAYQSVGGDSSMVQFVADCRINSYTVKTYPPEQYTIDSTGHSMAGTYFKPIYNENNEDDMHHVNQGIKSRPTFDLALYKDVLKADVSINGKTETYTYNARKDRAGAGFQLGINEDDYLTKLRDKYINNTNISINNTAPQNYDGIENYTQEMRTEEIINGNNSNANINPSKLYSEDKNYAWRDINSSLTDQDKLKIIVTYKLGIRNQSSVRGSVTEIADYYDSHYDFVGAFVGDENGNKTGNVTASPTSMYGGSTHMGVASGYTAIYLRPTEQILDDGQTQYVFVQLSLRDPEGTLVRAGLPSGDKLETYNYAEINGYKTYGIGNNGASEGLIDRDSKAGNFDQSNFVSNGNTASIEDDTNRAPTFIYSIRNSRTIEGTVFEDSIVSVNDAKLVNTNQERYGNGTLDNGDKKIKDIKVELIEVKNGMMIVRQTTYTDENGWYGFGAFVPGDYVIRFTYGERNETALTTTSAYQKGVNDTSYNGQDYTSTGYATKSPFETLQDQNCTIDSILKDTYTANNAMLGSEEQAVTVPQTQKLSKYVNDSYYWYSDGSIGGKSDAKEDEARRTEITKYTESEYGRGIVNHKAEVFNSFINQEELRKGNFDIYNQAQPMNEASDTYEKNEELVSELERRTYGYAYTAIMPIEVEYVTRSTDHATDNKITGVDFGLVERPKALLTLDQDVSHIKVTLTDGTVLYDTGTAVENLQWIAKGDRSRYDKKELINIILSDELLSGAKIEITYDITVTNNSEKGIGNSRAATILDYVANNLVFDLNNNNDSNGNALWDVVKVADVQTNSKATYVNNDLGTNNLKQVDLSTQNTILRASSTNPLVTTTLKPGESVTTQLVLNKVLSNGATTDDLAYTNLGEITEIHNDQGRYDRGAIPGNQDISVQPREHDTAGASRYVETDLITYPSDGEVIVTPPTGEENNISYIYIIVGITATAILAIGIVLIKKFAIKK